MSELHAAEKMDLSKTCEPQHLDQWNSFSILKNDSFQSPSRNAFDKANSIEDPYQKLADKQEIQVRSVEINGAAQHEFYAKIDGKAQVLLQTKQAPEIAEKQLRQLQDAKVKDLEKTYNLDIGKDGETTKSVDEKKDLAVTTPTLGESSAIEQAILHSIPDIKTTDGKPLRIVVGDKSWGSEFGAGGVKRNDEIVFAYSDNISYLKEVGVHELAHIGQAQREKASGYDGYAIELGWVKAGEDWLLRGKDGSYWQNTGKNGIWIRTDERGNPADSSGKRTDNPLNPFDHGENSGRVQTKNDAEVREIALVKPYSTYFGNPHEMGAAMLTPYRDNRELRAKLYNVSADSYAIAKDLDQYQINSAMGTEADGQAKYIRNPDGIVVQNTAENRQVIEQFEKSL